MTSIQQCAELQRRIWQIANDVRGAIDGWDCNPDFPLKRSFLGDRPCPPNAPRQQQSKTRKPWTKVERRLEGAAASKKLRFNGKSGLKTTAAKFDQLRKEIDTIVAKIDDEELQT